MRARSQGHALLVTPSPAVLSACDAQPPEQAAEVTGNVARSISSSQTGTDGGYYYYSFWTNGQGSCNMTLDGGSGYSLSWSNVGDFTASP